MVDYRVVVVKAGTSTLTDARGDLDLNYLRALAGQLAELNARGWRSVLVTSGAVRAGMRRLGLARCRELRQQQAAAAVGQVALMRLYADFFLDHGASVAQVLLTRGDIADRRRYLNARNTLVVLLERGIVPIINENDTVAVEEIQYGDNDQLAAQVAQLVGAELLVFLTDAEGLLLPDGTGSRLVREVTEITEEMENAAGGSRSGVGKGGMATKLLAAKMATRIGCKVVVTAGKSADGQPPVLAVTQGESLGTTFYPAPRTLSGRKRWLAQSGDPEGGIRIDEGAADALRRRHKSLLAVGVQDVDGDFEAGALVIVRGPSGDELARGLSNYSAAELRRIRGLRTWDIPVELGYDAGAEVIHRDNLALTEEPNRRNGMEDPS